MGENYITSFLERDLPGLGISVPAYAMRKFWMMVAHYHGQVVNYAELARSLGIAESSVRRYLDILYQTFMIRILPSWYVNIGKRLVKNPKIYIRDSGLYHSLAGIADEKLLSGSPKLGASWEGFAIEECIKSIGLPGERFYYWRTHNGAELDLYWEHQGKAWGIECKYMDAPSVSKSMGIALTDLRLEHLWVVYPGTTGYPLGSRITVMPISSVPPRWFYTQRHE